MSFAPGHIERTPRPAWVAPSYGLCAHSLRGFVSRPSASCALLLALCAQNRSGTWADRSARWPEALGKPWLGTPADRAGIVVGDVKQWTLARLAWLDGAWAQAMDETIRAGPYPEAFGKAAAA